MRLCSEPRCDRPRGGRNARCWMHLKRSVRRNQAYRQFQKDQLLEEDLDSGLSVLNLEIQGLRGLKKLY